MTPAKKFLKVLDSIGVTFYIKPKPQFWGDKDLTPKKKKELLSLDEHYLYAKWTSGGISGGSCWDNSSEDRHYTTTGESEPEFEDLDTILTVICPNLTFLQYKKLLTIVKRDGYSVKEYYGNSTEYSFKTIKLRDLFDKLVEMGLFE